MSAINCDLIFHLLDLQSRDVRIESEQDDIREVSYESNSDQSDDEEFTIRKKKKSISSFSQQRELVIHLFGSTESGQPIRCDVTGFRPTFYIRLPDDKISQSIIIIKEYIKKYYSNLFCNKHLWMYYCRISKANHSKSENYN